MKLTNQEILEVETALRTLTEKPLPILVSYKLAELGAIFYKQLRLIHELEKGLFKKHGKGYRNAQGQWGVPLFVEEKDGGGVIKKEPNPSVVQFQDEWEELLTQEVILDKLDGLKVKLPEKIASTCDQCHHNMDKSLEIAPFILIALYRWLEV